MGACYTFMFVGVVHVVISSADMPLLTLNIAIQTHVEEEKAAQQPFLTILLQCIATN